MFKDEIADGICWRPWKRTSIFRAKGSHRGRPDQVDVLIKGPITSEASGPATIIAQKASSGVEQNGLVVALNWRAANVKDTGHDLILRPGDGAVIVAIKNR